MLSNHKKQTSVNMFHKKNHTMNFIIIGIGILAIALTGITYVSKLNQSQDTVRSIENHMTRSV